MGSQGLEQRSGRAFHNFDPKLRAHVKCDVETLPVMHEMIKYGQSLYDQIKDRKAERSKEPEGTKAPIEAERHQTKRRRGLKETDPW